MLEQFSERRSYGPVQNTRFVFKERRLAVATLHSPRQNRLLAALPLADYARLLPNLEPVRLPMGWAVHGAGEQEKYLYFLTSGIVSRFYLTENGASAAFALTGSEGVIGVSLFLDAGIAQSDAVVVATGYAYRLRPELLKQEFTQCGALPHLLLRYTQTLINQSQQSAVCNRHHNLEQQLCCWILSCLDRLSSNTLNMTQELIANMLGVRREGVTDAAGKLQKLGLIHYRRGHITVIDRPKLEAHTCECYVVVKRAFDRLTTSPGEHFSNS